MSTGSESRFDAAIRDARNLVDIHRKLNPENRRGRRRLERALNRSVVVLAVAAWQAQVEDVASVLLTSMKPEGPSSSRLQNAMFNSVAAINREQIRRYNTPNASNTVRLLQAVGYEVEAEWRWQHGPVEIHPGEATKRLNSWVKVRQAIAHGTDLPSETVISTENKSGPSVRLRDAEACLAFFEALARQTREGAYRIISPETDTSVSSGGLWLTGEVPATGTTLRSTSWSQDLSRRLRDLSRVVIPEPEASNVIRWLQEDSDDDGSQVE